MTPQEQEAADHWHKLADEELSWAVYEEQRGHSGLVHRNKAVMYRHTAMAIELTAKTGQHHCACHLAAPCPNSRRTP